MATNNTVSFLERGRGFLNRKTAETLSRISPRLGAKYIYKVRTGKKLNLKNPKLFNEKIQWLKLNWKDPRMVQCADKYAVRAYVEEKGLSHILNELYGVYEKASDINWDNLPEKFVMKTNNGFGTVLLVDEKSKLNKEQTEQTLTKWLQKDYSLATGEVHYKKIKPLLLAEKYLESKDNTVPVDYKIFCFHGKPEFILTIVDRNVGEYGESYRRYFLDLDWQPLDFEKGKSPDIQNLPQKPESLDLMIEYAEKLADDIPLVRVDFYEVDSKPVFGEMTFTPAAGLADYFKEDINLKLGEKIQLPTQ